MCHYIFKANKNTTYYLTYGKRRFLLTTKQSTQTAQSKQIQKKKQANDISISQEIQHCTWSCLSWFNILMQKRKTNDDTIYALNVTILLGFLSNLARRFLWVVSETSLTYIVTPQWPLKWLANHVVIIYALLATISFRFMQVPMDSDSDEFNQHWHISLNMCIHNDFVLFCGYCLTVYALSDTILLYFGPNSHYICVSTVTLSVLSGLSSNLLCLKSISQCFRQGYSLMF